MAFDDGPVARQIRSMLAQISTATPPPDAIRKTASEVIARADYDLGAELPRESSLAYWLEILRWIIQPFRWLFESLDGLPDPVRWLIVILAVLLCAALIAHIIYSFVSAVRGPAARRPGTYQSSARVTDPAELEQAAERAGARGDYIGAVRLLFRAALRRIELAEKRSFQPGFTNRELLRRYQSSALSEPLRRLVEVIDLKWYGDTACEASDYSACKSEHDRIRQHIAGVRIAVGA
jgi:hypothetical protein